MSYVVCYYLATFELKIPLAHGEKKANCVKRQIEPIQILVTFKESNLDFLN
jgi:hypothetical protein